jgi:hypothetical protein
MKKISWTEIGIATPTILVFASFGGMSAMLYVSVGLAVSMVVLWWTGRAVEAKILVPSVVRARGSNR